MVFKEFTEIVMKNSITFGISVAVISGFVNELLFSFINDIILPFFDRDDNSDPDINKLRHIVFSFNGINVRVGSFVISLIRFSILLIILFVITFILLKMK